jgi:NADPH:quinone reductase-like Zn-dependent oxidoreductase
VRAYLLDRYGKGATLRLAELPEPVLGEHDVLVDIRAAALNPLDAKIRDGEFKAFLRYRFPLVLGHDLAGVVTRVGSQVRQFKPGDEVIARPRDGRIGALAERIAIDEADVALKPANTSMEEAASLPLVALTAWQVLVERAGVQPGQKVLIHAGSGGVGALAIQLARQLGATVASTTSTRNVGWVRQLGAEVVIDYTKEDFSESLGGYDVVLNSLDRRTLEKSLRVLKPGGKLISISGPPDAAFARSIGLNWALQQVMRMLSLGIRRRAARRGVDYSFLFMRANGEQLGRIAALVESGAIRPVVDRVFPFAAVGEAMAYLETGRAKGKVVISMA